MPITIPIVQINTGSVVPVLLETYTRSDGVMVRRGHCMHRLTKKGEIDKRSPGAVIGVTKSSYGDKLLYGSLADPLSDETPAIELREQIKSLKAELEAKQQALLRLYYDAGSIAP